MTGSLDKDHMFYPTHPSAARQLAKSAPAEFTAKSYLCPNGKDAEIYALRVLANSPWENKNGAMEITLACSSDASAAALSKAFDKIDSGFDAKDCNVNVQLTQCGITVTIPERDFKFAEDFAASKLQSDEMRARIREDDRPVRERVK